MNSKSEFAPPASELGSVSNQARKAILDLIVRGTFAPGSKLPGERQLASDLSVSRSALRAALVALEEEGTLESIPWRGWFVRVDRMIEEVALQSFTELAQRRGLSAGAEVVQQKIRTATIEEARDLVVPPGAEVLELHRIRTLDGNPACYDKAIIALTRAPQLRGEDFSNRSLYERLKELADVTIVRSDYTVRAAAASEAIAGYLNLAPNAPVLIGQEIAKDVKGDPILLGRVVYRSDAYEFQATLFRRL